MVQSSARAVSAEDRIEPGRPRAERGKAGPDKEWQKAWWDWFRADKNSARTLQDKARAGGHREGEETVNMKRSGRNHCWIRTVLGLE